MPMLSCVCAEESDRIAGEVSIDRSVKRMFMI